MLFVFIFVTYGQVFSEACPLEYRVTDPNHSFCATPIANVIDQVLTMTERDLILELHNRERRLVRGINVEKMYWNDQLADIARGHARRCLFESDKPNQRSVPKMPLSTGQNLAMGYDNWTEVIQGWIEEKEHYYHAYPSTNLFKRYKQMIWHSSALIGCAATICPPFGSYSSPWTFYVCNYIRGMLETNYRPAYEPTTKDHPLRDCQGRVCLYNGTLDLDTCQCQCPTYTTGLQCEQLNCLNLPPCRYVSPISCIAADVLLECPRLCGLCDRYEILSRMSVERTPFVDEMTTAFLEASDSVSIDQNETASTPTEVLNTTLQTIVISRSNASPLISWPVFVVLSTIYFIA